MKKEREFANKKEIAIVNSVTATRFLGSFLVIPVFKTLGGLAAAAFSSIFLFTDFIDGFLARKLKASTFFGALFDGATDKAYGILAFLLLMTINPVVFSIPLLLELGIIAAQNNKYKNGLNVQSSMTGKVKTWFLSLSIISSFAAVDLFNMPPILDYIKNASLDKVALIKDSLILLGIEIPTIITQILTYKSYSKASEQEVDNNIVKEEPSEEKHLDKDISYDLNELTPDVSLQEIADEKQKLQEELSLLEKAKVLGDALFDPEYYAKNKNVPIRTLTKDLFNPNNQK